MKWLKDYFDLTRKEQTGMMALIGLIVLLFALQFVWAFIVPNHKAVPNFLKQSIDTLDRKASTDSSKVDENAPKNGKTILTSFDPNQIDIKGLENMGLSPIVSNHIVHYREKGGHFYKPEDLKKIYGLTEDQYHDLEPYIQISNIKEDDKTVLIDLNKADSIQLLSVRGIGPVFASRILYMRRQLGAFIDKKQLLDVYGIDESHYQSMQNQVYTSKMRLHTININTATANMLIQNPYIRYKLAHIIINYREAHGPFASVDDLKNIYAIDTKAFEKMRPYLVVK